MTLRKLCGLVTLLGVLVALSGCEVGGPEAPTASDLAYTVSVKLAEHGTVTAIPDRALEGTGIRLAVNPEPGYYLTSLKWHKGGTGNLWGQNQTDVNQNALMIYNFDLPVGGAWVTAEFSPLLIGQRSVTLVTGDHGNVIATPTAGGAGTSVRLVFDVEGGFAIRTGFPKITGGAWVPGREGLQFTIDGTSNVTVTTEFERPTSVDNILQLARKALDAEEYDAAFADYEIAYQADRNNEEAILYSTLGQLLTIPTGAKARSLLRTLGMVGISTPSTINGWLDLDTTRATSWLASYTDENNEVYKLPRIGPPNNYPGGFLNYTLFTKNSGKRRLFDILLFWNLLGNNPNGFDAFLKGLLTSMFGDQFEAACQRAATLPETASVVLHPNLKAKFGLEGVYGSGTTSVGKADLEVLIAFLRSVKASLEWVSAYGWEMDMTIFRVESDDQSTLNDILQRMFRDDKPLVQRLLADGNNRSLATILPLRSLFLKNQDAGMMQKAKADLQTAIATLDRSFGGFYGKFTPAAQTKYRWMTGDSGFVKQFKVALESGGDVYFPPVPQYKTFFDTMAGENTWVTSTSGSLGVNLGYLFVPGYLNADQIITTEDGGKAPKFFGFKSGAGSPINSAEELGAYDTFGLEFGPHVKDVFVKIDNKTASNYRWVSDVFPQVFPQTDAADMAKAKSNIGTLYDYYQRR